MPLNNKSRPDIAYLRRRPRLGETPKHAPVAPKKASTSLNLSRNTAVNNAAPVAPLLPDAPRIDASAVLSVENPVVRLNARQSAIGSLTFTGVAAFGWESQSGLGGLLVASQPIVNTHPDNQVPMYSNRALVEFYKGDVVLGLRHFRELRRMVLAAPSGTIEANLYGDTRIIADTNDGNNVLLISVIDNEIECRLEVLSGADIMSSFSFPVQHQ